MVICIDLQVIVQYCIIKVEGKGNQKLEWLAVASTLQALSTHQGCLELPHAICLLVLCGSKEQIRASWDLHKHICKLRNFPQFVTVTTLNLQFVILPIASMSCSLALSSIAPCLLALSSTVSNLEFDISHCRTPRNLVSSYI